jgi:metallophosphoesterase (TIGR00282 family)
VVRPANYPANVPGQGWAAIPLSDGRKLGLVNVLGRVFLDPFDCPFEAAQEAVDALRGETSTILVDVHAEATSEKIALGWYLDGRCSAVVGTHTHVQTADERILPGGTAYITDVGMTGPVDSVIGVEKEAVIERFLTGLPIDFQVASGRTGLNAVYLELDDETGGARRIARIQRVSQ